MSLSNLSSSFGVPEDQIRFALSTILHIPIGLLFRKLVVQSDILPLALKHLSCFFIGAGTLWFLFGLSSLHVAVISVAVFFFTKYLSTSYAHKLSFFFSMGYLFVLQSIRMYIDYYGWALDVTAPMMVSVIKLSSYAFCRVDGRIAQERKEKGLDPTEGMSEHQKTYMISKQPSLPEFLGFAYFFAGAISGPAIEFHEYASLMDRSMFPKGVIPKNVLAVLTPFLRGLVLMILIPIIPLGAEDLRKIVYSSGFWIYRVLWVYFTCITLRMKYYCIWCLAQASGNATGIGYKGVDKNGVERWDRLNNVNILAFEFAPNFKVALDNWNIRTEKWLRHYVFERLQGTSLQAHRKLLTMITSALWHGLHPGYYISFLSAAFYSHIAQQIRKKLRPHILSLPTSVKPQLIYDILTTTITIVTMLACFSPFALLGFWDGIAVMHSFYALHAIALLLAFGLPFIPNGPHHIDHSATAKKSE